MHTRFGKNIVLVLIAIFVTQLIAAQTISENGITVSKNPSGLIITRAIDEDIIPTTETDNAEEIISSVFDAPFRIIQFRIPSEIERSPNFNSLEEITIPFNITLSENQIAFINNSKRYEMLSINSNSVMLYIYKAGNTYFKLFVVEYTSNANGLVPQIPADFSLNEIIQNFGLPNFQSVTSDILVYYSPSTLRQINIYLNDDRVEQIQLIAWGGE